MKSDFVKGTSFPVLSILAPTWTFGPIKPTISLYPKEVLSAVLGCPLPKIPSLSSLFKVVLLLIRPFNYIS